jgi:hypothetical protein
MGSGVLGLSSSVSEADKNISRSGATEQYEFDDFRCAVAPLRENLSCFLDESGRMG